MKTEFTSRTPLDLVGGVTIVVVVTAVILGVAFAVARPLILEKLIPLGVLIYSEDGVIGEWGIQTLDSFLKAMAPLSFAVAGLGLGYGLLWRYFSGHLQPQSAQPVAAVPSISAFELCCLTAILTLAIVMRLHDGILARGLTYDEVFTAMNFVDVDSLRPAVSTYPAFNNHIAYSILAWIAKSLLGRQEWSLRLPALIFGLASIYFFWSFTRQFFGRNVALLGALGLALSPVHTVWSTLGRGYSGMILFTTISSYLFLRLLNNRGSVRDAFMFAGASTMAIYFHLSAVFVSGVQISFLVYLAIRQCLRDSPAANLSRDSFRLLWGLFGALVGLAVICYAPVLPQLILQIVQKGTGEFRPLFPLKVLQMFSGYTEGPFLITVSAMALLGLVFLRRSHPKESDYLTVLLILPLLVAWISRPYYLTPRFFVYFLPFYVLLVASGFNGLWQFTGTSSRRNTYLWRSLVCVIALSTVSTWTDKSWANKDEQGFRETASVMERNATESTALCAIGGNGQLYRYYSTRKVSILDSIEEFEELSQTYSEIRCAYFDVSSRRESMGTKKLLEFLYKRTESQQLPVGTHIIFTYRNGHPVQSAGAARTEQHRSWSSNERDNRQNQIGNR